jgi:uncharacterized protein GlcG (DUF336 family)
MRASTIFIALAVGASTANAQDATFAVRQLTPETALRAAQAAIETCRKNGYQVAVAVADRNGTPQVLLRDRFAGPHTVEVAINKAWTSASFKQDTVSLGQASRADGPAAPVRHFSRVVVMGGGVPIEAGGSLLGAIAVSGAPGGDADDACAKAGIEAIRQDIDF